MKFLNILIIALLTISPAMAEKVPAPDFSLLDVSGKPVSLSDFKGKVVLLNFWATWCNVCVEEMEGLNKLYRDMKDNGFLVIAVSIDQSRNDVAKFVSSRRLEFPVLLDPEKEVYFDKYAVFGLPTSFLIDKKGYIRDRYIGENDWGDKKFIQKVLELLAE